MLLKKEPTVQNTETLEEMRNEVMQIVKKREEAWIGWVEILPGGKKQMVTGRQMPQTQKKIRGKSKEEI